MRRKAHLPTIVLMVLTALFSTMGLFTRNAICRLEPPEVNVIPSQARIDQQVIVKATIDVVSC